jgi:TRAP transporter TAXI family solute receptor
MSKVVYALTAAAAATVLVASAAVWYTARDPLPAEIRIAAGQHEGLYHTFAREFAARLQQRTGRPVLVLLTAGTGGNTDLIRTGGADLALIQTTSLTPDGVAGVAPLFPEPLHFIVRKTGAKEIGSPADLRDRRVALGLSGSAIRRNARTILEHYGAPAGVDDRAEHFSAVADKDVAAALVTTGWMNPLLEKLFRSGDYDLVGLADPEAVAARHPWLVPTTIPRGLYPGRTPVPAEPVRTVAATALLAARADASDELVRAALAALYETDIRASFPGLTSAKAAREYDAAVMHHGVAAYHDPAVRFARLTRAMELASKSKEALFGVVAFGVLVWGWLRRRRERRAAAADQVQKQKLDEFIGRTLTVELEQMDVSDPEQLRPYLRRVTHIKQEALKELTSEKVRGDQLFAIFLSQCAALSEKIQMRMIYGRLTAASG